MTQWFDLTQQIKQWGEALGFQQVGISDTDVAEAKAHYKTWLANGYAGEMDYLSKHGEKRYDSALLIPGTIRVISARLDYLPPDPQIIETLQNPNRAFISRYAVGGDYHKILKKKLKQLALQITEAVGECSFRPFVDTGPVLEKAFAAKAGLGWQGKHTNLLNRHAGSYFFLGILFTNLPLVIDTPVKNHCGSCQACLKICPTQAIVAPYVLDARRCISYLTIELKGSIPIEFRKSIGNRIYGCDDCQLVCPWNRYAKPSQDSGFTPRNNFLTTELLELFAWSEEEFLSKTAGMAIRRINYECWLRNIAVALGNAPTSQEVIKALQEKLSMDSAMVREHILWALAQHVTPYTFSDNYL